MRRAAHKYSQGTIAIAIFAFILTAVPKLNVRVGPVPVYFMDFLIILIAYYAFRRPGFLSGPRPFRVFVIVLFIFAMMGEIVGFIYTGEVFNHVYIVIRTVLAFLVFYSVGQLIRTPQDLQLVLKGLTLGLLATSLIMILTSLPQTRGFVASLLFTNTFLEPAGLRAAERYLDSGESGVRGRTLVGVSIVGASYINIIWPMVAVLYAWPRDIGIWRKMAMAACFLAPLGVLMSYSRGPIIGSILIILATSLLGMHFIRKGILASLALSVVLVLAIGVNSQVFFFERLVNRTQAIVENPYQDERESERILAYVEPFEHVVENPEFLLTGQGNAINRSFRVRAEAAGKASHAVFAVAYYSQGLVAAFVYMALFGSMLLYTLRNMSARVAGPGAMMSQALFASTLGVLPWAIFGHAIVSTPRGAMMFFFLLGMLTVLRHFPLATQARRPTGGRYGYRHPIAV